MVDGIKRMVGHVDYCCANQISKIELLSMAHDFKLDIQGCTIWWLNTTQGNIEWKEIKTDQGELFMAMNVSCKKELCVFIGLRSGISLNNDGIVGIGQPSSEKKDYVQEEEAIDVEDEDSDLEGELIGGHIKEKIDEDIHDSEYSFSDELELESMGNGDRDRVVVIVGEGPIRLADEDDVESDYARSDEINSCSSTDKDELMSNRPKYAKFNEECDMKNPKFKFGMKFRSFKHFKDAVKNYGIINRYVINFKPNSKKRCKVFCKRGCPLYLWEMVTDGNTMQIKSENFRA